MVSRELHLHYEDLAVHVAGLYVHAVELVVLLLLVALALQDGLYGAFLACEYFYEAFQDLEVGLVAEEFLYCPVEPHVVWCSHDCVFFAVLLLQI